KLGELHEGGGPGIQGGALAKALVLYEKACDGGEPSGCVALGLFLADHGRPEGVARKITLLTRACDKGDGPACSELARGDATGKGAGKEPSRAEAFEQKAAPLDDRACEAGDLRACLDRARALARGVGAARDDARAASLDERACDAGLSDGCAAL